MKSEQLGDVSRTIQSKHREGPKAIKSKQLEDVSRTIKSEQREGSKVIKSTINSKHREMSRARNMFFRKDQK
eukprot:CAMPEP_0184671210 /NCGR_PEP_ID=MMETSP0308-20130426/85364_1 /TAXON_ID=38269 /ORGANISM="Gloeochaete witrockiana, Strain SAG 46.84" /LENGTH=71 /DNA_ID=CAMNT_0027118293 /DNA_START=1898 /DNA_END=2113 /DNA_ORIENTATION=-